MAPLSAFWLLHLQQVILVWLWRRSRGRLLPRFCGACQKGGQTAMTNFYLGLMPWPLTRPSRRISALLCIDNTAIHRANERMVVHTGVETIGRCLPRRSAIFLCGFTALGFSALPTQLLFTRSTVHSSSTGALISPRHS